MKEFFAQQIHSGWRQGIGIALIFFGIISAVFYYVEMYAIGKNVNATAASVNAATEKQIAKSSASPTVVASPISTPQKVEGKIKLSSATQTELETLPGIGPTKAKAIIDYRATHPFKTVSDLNKVKGIGQKTLDKLKPLVEL